MTKKQIIAAVLSLIGVVLLGVFLYSQVPKKAAKPKIESKKEQVQVEIQYVSEADEQITEIGGGYIYRVKKNSSDQIHIGELRVLEAPDPKMESIDSPEADAFREQFNAVRLNLGQIILFPLRPDLVAMEVYQSPNPGVNFVGVFTNDGVPFAYVEQHIGENGEVVMRGNDTDYYANKMHDQYEADKYAQEELAKYLEQEKSE